MNKRTTEAAPAGPGSLVKRLASRPARIPSNVVLGGDSKVIIVHGAEEYVLRATGDGKLVLSR